MLEHGGIGRPARSSLPSTRFHSGAAIGYWHVTDILPNENLLDPYFVHANKA